MPQTSLPGSTSTASGGVVGRAMLLGVALFAVAICWCGILPAVSRHFGHGIATQKLEDVGVDAGAMFYTEHKRMLKPPGGR